MYDNVMSVLQNRWIQFIGVLLILVLAGYLFYLVTPLLIPIFLALLVAYLLNPVVGFLEQRGVRRTLSTGALGLLGALFLVMIPIFLVPRLVGQAERLVLQARASIQSAGVTDADEGDFLSTVMDWLPLEQFVRTMGWWPPPTDDALEAELQAELDAGEGILIDARIEAADEAEPSAAEGSGLELESSDLVDDAEALEPVWEEYPPLTDEVARAVIAERIGNAVRENIQTIVRRYASSAVASLRVGSATLADFVTAVWRSIVWFLALLVSFSIFSFATGYILISFDRLIEHSKELVPERHREKTFSIVSRIDEQLRSFVRGQFVVSLIEACIYSVGLSIAQVPFAIPLGVVIGFIIIVPYIGVMLGFITSVLLALVAHGLDWHILAVIGTFVAVQTAEEAFLKPVIVGDKVGLHPVWVMMSFLVFGNALGFLGVLLAVPIAASLKVLVLEAFEYYQKSKLYRARKAADG